MDGSSVSAAPNLRHPYTIRSRRAKFRGAVPAAVMAARHGQTLARPSNGAYGRPACGASTVAINSLPVGDAAASCAIDDCAVNMNNVRPSSPPSMQA